MTMNGLPEPPVDIRLQLSDGTELPVEAVYVGRDENDDHVWEITTSVHVDRLDTLTVGALPPRTVIRLGVEGI